jgi:hypothetical protein
VAALVFALSIGSTTVAFASTGKGAAGARVASLGSVRVATVGVADEIPGTEWTELKTANTATFTGSLSVDPATGIGTNDVLRVYFKAGEVVTFDLNGADDTDFGLAVWGPDMFTVYTDFDNALADVAPYYYGGPDTYPLTVDSLFIAKSGYYYVNPYTWVDPDDPSADGGSGTYTLTATIEHPYTSIWTAPISTLQFGDSATISGHVDTRVPGGVPGYVWLMASNDGVHYEAMDVQELSTGGMFTFQAPDNTTTMHYMIHYDGTELNNPSSARVTANMLALLSNPTATRYGTRSYRLSGYLGSWHAAGSSAVRVYIWRYVNSKWKAYSYRTAKVASSGVLSKFTASYKFPYAGKWRMQAYHSDANHATTKSGYVTFTVK